MLWLPPAKEISAPLATVVLFPLIYHLSCKRQTHDTTSPSRDVYVKFERRPCQRPLHAIPAQGRFEAALCCEEARYVWRDKPCTALV